MHENRETSSLPEGNGAGRSVKALDRTTDMNGGEESDGGIVCAEQRIVQEG